MTIHEGLNPNENRKVVLDLLLRLFIAMSLLLLGIAVISGPKWEPEIIYFGIANNHGFTLQDAVALVPISLGLIFFSIGLWKYRLLFRHYIRKSPEVAFMIALVVGILIGLFLGTGFGTVFEATIVSFAKTIFR